MGRSVVAVIAGLAVAVAMVMLLTSLAGMVAGVPPAGPPTPLYLMLNLLGGALAGAAGGATAMALAPHTPHGHVFALAGVILLLSLPMIFSSPVTGQPGWYAPLLSVLGPASVLAGGWVEARRRERSLSGG